MDNIISNEFVVVTLSILVFLLSLVLSVCVCYMKYKSVNVELEGFRAKRAELDSIIEGYNKNSKQLLEKKLVNSDSKVTSIKTMFEPKIHSTIINETNQFDIESLSIDAANVLLHLKSPNGESIAVYVKDKESIRRPLLKIVVALTKASRVHIEAKVILELGKPVVRHFEIKGIEK